jgi:hypothetical protein
MTDEALREVCIKGGRDKVEKEFDIKMIARQKLKLFQRAAYDPV